MGFLDKYRYKKTIPLATVRRFDEACDLIILSHRLNARADRQRRLLSYYSPESHQVNTIFLSHDTIVRWNWPANSMAQRYCYATQFDKWDKILFEVYFIVFDYGASVRTTAVEFPEDQEIIGKAVQRQLSEWPDEARFFISEEAIEANRTTSPNYAANPFSNFVV